VRKHAFALKQFTHENGECFMILGLVCRSFRFFAVSTVDF